MDPTIALALLLAVLVLVSIAVHRWWVLVLPLVAVPLFYVGVANEWWGYGLGDGWQYALAAVLGVSLLACALAVALTRRFVHADVPRRTA